MRKIALFLVALMAVSTFVSAFQSMDAHQGISTDQVKAVEAPCQAG